MKCKMCESEVNLLDKANILNKYLVSYFRCGNCGFIFTEEPYWLDESYSDAIADSDIGLIDRNLHLFSIGKSIVSAFFDPNAKFLDYGGGYGMYVRLMRDAGYDFSRYDLYCENLFAKGFDVESNDERFELITAFEVFEHLPNPFVDIEKMFRFSDSILFTTELVPKNTPKPHEWWYYCLDHGQHVSLYTLESLSIIAEKFGINLVSNGHSIHLFTKKKINPSLFKFFSKSKVAKVRDLLIKRRSLLPIDYKKITNIDLS